MDHFSLITDIQDGSQKNFLHRKSRIDFFRIKSQKDFFSRKSSNFMKRKFQKDFMKKKFQKDFMKLFYGKEIVSTIEKFEISQIRKFSRIFFNSLGSMCVKLDT